MAFQRPNAKTCAGSWANAAQLSMHQRNETGAFEHCGVFRIGQKGWEGLAVVEIDEQ